MLDEHFSPEIAVQLRSKDHDVAAVKERIDLISLSDRPLMETMTIERRAIVTNDVADYIKLFSEMAEMGLDHYGVLFTDDRSMPRTRASIGLFVRVLGDILLSNPSDDALRNQLRWLHSHSSGSYAKR